MPNKTAIIRNASALAAELEVELVESPSEFSDCFAILGTCVSRLIRRGCTEKQLADFIAFTISDKLTRQFMMPVMPASAYHCLSIFGDTILHVVDYGVEPTTLVEYLKRLIRHGR